MKRFWLIGLALLLSASFLLSGCDFGADSFYYDDDYEQNDIGGGSKPAKDSEKQTEASKDSEAESVTESKTEAEKTTEKDSESTSKPETESEKITETDTEPQKDSETESDFYSELGIPSYSGTPYVHLNGGIPNFSDKEITTESYEYYSPMDPLGRCGIAHACIGTDLMPTDDRESISSVKPSGWGSNNHKYDTSLVNGGYIYNRSHLIGFQLTGENANARNLITGTRYFNVEGMLPFENMVADYLKEEPDHHVMYRVTPIYDGNNLVVHGVQMEAYSVEDEGEGICFNVFIYNVQPGIVIDYATGENWLAGDAPAIESESVTESMTDSDTVTYVLNTSSKKFHLPSCSSALSMKEENKKNYTGTRDALIEDGYVACGICHP